MTCSICRRPFTKDGYGAQAQGTKQCRDCHGREQAFWWRRKQ